MSRVCDLSGINMAEFEPEMRRYATEYHACSLESLPVEAAGVLGGEEASLSLSDPQVYSCGIYELEDGTAREDRTRKGAVEFISTEGELKGSHAMSSGVLDLQWSRELVACAMSTGELHVLKAAADYTLEPMAVSVAEEGTEETEGYFLSVDWGQDVNSDIAVSTQEGSLLVYRLSETCLEEMVHITGAHSMMGGNMPAWTTIFDPFSSNRRLVSGGDDMKMRLWDLRGPCATASDAAATNSKTHTAGVTFLKWHPTREHCFASGSYDESVRLWDDRNVRTPVAEMAVGGGVWRIKWRLCDADPSSALLAVAGMQHGSSILRADFPIADVDSEMAEEASLSHIGAYDFGTGDKMLNYGIDFLNSSTDDNERKVTLVSSSFYDNLVDVWTWTAP